MKTTVEIADDLAVRLRTHLKSSGVTMRTALDQALRKWIESQGESRRPAIDSAVGVFRGDGLSPEYRGRGWDRIRDASYGDDE